MKPRIYLIILLLIIPIQASLFSPLSLAGIKPDLALAVIYIIGLLTGPGEAALAGIGIGLVQDIGSASFIGLNGFTRGLIGLFAGLFGKRVLDISSPSNFILLAAFSLAVHRPDDYAAQYPQCDLVCSNDFNGDCQVDDRDQEEMVKCVGG